MDGDWDGKVQRTDDKEDILGTALSSTRSTRRTSLRPRLNARQENNVNAIAAVTGNQDVLYVVIGVLYVVIGVARVLGQAVV